MAVGVASMTTDWEERFWSKVNRNGPIPDARPDLGKCWIWNAPPTFYGYGQFNLNGSPRRAHVLSYELLVGPVPEGLELDHLCLVKICVRPAHLEPVTHLENVLRGGAWGQDARAKAAITNKAVWAAKSAEEMDQHRDRVSVGQALTWLNVDRNPVNCKHCGQECRGPRGLSVHVGHKHKEADA
jgi:hypothetical protein